MALPHGMIEFAGVERSSWPDNMEGAIRSGERAARAVLTAVVCV
ncbi:MAG: FAD-dependent oxidoreductase [Trebonia sp.]